MTFEQYWETTELSKRPSTLLIETYREIAEKAFMAGYDSGYDEGWGNGLAVGLDTSNN
jgi:hypothetical protein